MENGPGYSWFTYLKWWFSIVILVDQRKNELRYKPLPLWMVFLNSLLLLLNENPPFTGHFTQQTSNDSCSARTLKHALWILLDPFGVTSAQCTDIKQKYLSQSSSSKIPKTCQHVIIPVARSWHLNAWRTLATSRVFSGCPASLVIVSSPFRVSPGAENCGNCMQLVMAWQAQTWITTVSHLRPTKLDFFTFWNSPGFWQGYLHWLQHTVPEGKPAAAFEL